MSQLLLLTALMQAAAAEVAPPLRALIVTGVDHPAHDWKQTAPVLREVLEASPRIAARIVEDPEVLSTALIQDYDVIVLHFRNDRPLARDAQARSNLASFVSGGKGLVLVHFASGAFGDWPEFADLAGMVWDLKNTHDPRGPFRVRIAAPDHPITRGLGDFETDDELYIGLTGTRPVTVLATARSKVTGRDHPIAFAFDYGRGRVFHCALGHDARALRIEPAGELLRRGTLWAAEAGR